MDGLPHYHQPSNTRWMKLLFLTTGFIIGGMCLWAFMEKRGNRPARSPSFARADTGREAMPSPQVAVSPDPNLLPAESPARAVIQASHLQSIPAEPAQPVQRVSYESPDVYPMFAEELPVEQPHRASSLKENDNPALASANAYSQPVTGNVAAVNYHEPVAGERHLPAEPTVVQPTSIETKRDDSFWQIAERVYGDPRYYRALFEYNRDWIAYPDQIEQGFQVMTPTVDELKARYPRLCPES